MEGMFQNILEISIMASFMIVAVWLVRLCFKKTTAVFRCLLWMLVGIRLLIPVNIAVPFSLVPAVNLSEIQQSETVQSGEITEGAQNRDGIADYGENSGEGIVIGTQEMSKEQNQGLQNSSDKGLNQSGVGNSGAGQSETVSENVIDLLVGKLSGKLSLYTVGAVIWLSGMVLMLGYMVISGLRLHKSLETAVPETVTFGEKQIKIYRDEHMSSPFLLGIFSPKIYVPFQMDKQNLQYVLAHELTHIRRRDYLWKPLSFVVLSFYWFHPLVWVAYILLGQDIEAACDEQVLRGELVSDKTAYAKALLSCASGQRRIAVCPVAFGESDVKKRVNNVMSYKKPGVLAIMGCVLLGVVIALCFMTVAENREKNLTMETLLELTENGKLEKQIEKKGLDAFLKYENMTQVGVPEGSVSATCKSDLSYKGKEYMFELYYQLPKAEGEEALVDTIYVSYPLNHEKEAIYTIRDNVESVDLQEYLDYIEYTYTLDTYVTYTLPEGFTIGDMRMSEGIYKHAMLEGDVEDPPHPEDSAPWTYGAGGIGFFTDFYPVRFENGEPVSVDWMAIHMWTVQDSFEKVEGCFTSALLAEVEMNWAASEYEEYAKQRGITVDEAMKICENPRFWYVFICNEQSEMGYVIFLNQLYFTKEDAITLARSIRPAGEDGAQGSNAGDIQQNPADEEFPQGSLATGDELQTLTMEGLLELAKENGLEKSIEEKGIHTFLIYENLESTKTPEGAVSETFTCELEYKGMQYVLELYIRLGKEGVPDYVDTVYMTYPESGDKQAIYTIRDNIETVELQEFLDFVHRAYNLDSHITYQLPEGFSLGEFEIHMDIEEAAYDGCLLVGDMEEPIYGDIGVDWSYAPGGIGTFTEFNRITFENGKPVGVSYRGTHYGVHEDSFETVEGCFTSALLTEISFDLFTAAEQAAYMEEHPEMAGVGGWSQSVYWYVFICDEESEVGYVVFLNQKYFTKEDVLAFARSIKPLE